MSYRHYHRHRHSNSGYHDRPTTQTNRYWTSTKVAQAISEAKNYGIDFINTKYGMDKVTQIRDQIEKSHMSPTTRTERAGSVTTPGGTGTGTGSHRHGRHYSPGEYHDRYGYSGEYIGEYGGYHSGHGHHHGHHGHGHDYEDDDTDSGQNTGGQQGPSNVTDGDWLSMDDQGRFMRPGQGDGGPSDPVPPPPTNTGFPGGNFAPKMKLNLENDEELAQGYQTPWAQPTSISSTITGLLRQSQNASSNYWDQFFANKGGQYALDARASSSFGVDPRWTPDAPTASALAMDNPMGAFGVSNTYTGFPQMAGQYAGAITRAQIEASLKRTRDVNQTLKELGITDLTINATGPGGSTDVAGITDIIFKHVQNNPMYNGDEDIPVDMGDGNDTGDDTNAPPEDTGPPPPEVYNEEAPILGEQKIPTGGTFNPWAFGMGGDTNSYGPSQQYMAQSTMESMALANAYFAPQRMELAYELGDMETDMRRLAVNLGRQVDDPVLQAKLYKESMRAVRTLDVQQNTFAFQMAEQRRKEELQNFQFYDQLAQEEYKSYLQNRLNESQLELQGRYYGLQRWNVMHPPGMTSTGSTTTTGTGTSPAGAYAGALAQRQFSQPSTIPAQPSSPALSGLYGNLLGKNPYMSSMGRVTATKSGW